MQELPRFNWRRNLLVLTGVLAGSAVLFSQQAAKPASKEIVRVDRAPLAAKSLEEALNGQRAYIDPKTGQLAAPQVAPDDSPTARMALAAPAIEAAPEVVALPGGGQAIAASPASLDFLSVTRMPDGRMAYRCKHGLDPASKTFTADHDASSKEVRNDR